jgi:signal transduction histidine kinase
MIDIDLKSPIARIRGMAEIALTTAKTPAEFKVMAGSVIEECDRLLDIINTMLMISKTEAGVEKPSREKIDLTSLVREACELFGTTAEDTGLTLSCQVPAQCVIAGDAGMIQRLLSNLLDNAIKYTSIGGQVVEISLSPIKEREVTLTVKDTGIGISAEDLPRIFERFYRGDRSRSEPGTGLGLSLARAIAHVHGGDITVESRLQEGSVFTVTLASSG